MSKKNNLINNQNSLLPRLDAIIVLLVGLLQQVSKNKESAQSVREKAAAVLMAGGLITQERVAKLLIMKKEKAVKAAKKKI